MDFVGGSRQTHDSFVRLSSWCRQLEAALKRLHADITDEEALDQVDRVFRVAIMDSSGHPATMPPQIDILGRVFGNILQIWADLADNQNPEQYRQVIAHEYQALTGKTVTMVAWTYGPLIAPLWLSEEGRPAWYARFSSVMADFLDREELTPDIVRELGECLPQANPTTIAGSLASRIARETMRSRWLNPWDAKHWERLAEAHDLSRGLTSGTMARVEHLVMQLEGNAPLNVERLCRGWRNITTQIW